MNNKKDWEKIEREKKIRDISIIQKYGFDINAYTEKTFSKESLEKRKKRSFLIKLLIILLIFLTIILQINSVNMKMKAVAKERIINDMRNIYNDEVKFISDKTYWRGNGFYILETNDVPNIQMHVVVNGEDISNDFNERYYKYYFEKWENENKNKFIVNETYEDYTYKTKTMKNWLLNYYTYIEVSNYEEMMEATEYIISFIEYIQNRKVLLRSYIKVKDELIIPHGTIDESNEEIRESAKNQYYKITKE